MFYIISITNEEGNVIATVLGGIMVLIRDRKKMVLVIERSSKKESSGYIYFDVKKTAKNLLKNIQ